MRKYSQLFVLVFFLTRPSRSQKSSPTVLLARSPATTRLPGGRQKSLRHLVREFRGKRLTYRFDETIDAVSTIALFRQLEQAYPEAPRIIVFCDNARYYKSKLVAEYLETSRIQMEPLPPYSPNLNLIDRFCKFFKKNVLYNRYYERFQDFRDASNAFLSGLDAHVPRLRTLLTENFQIVSN